MGGGAVGRGFFFFFVVLLFCSSSFPPFFLSLFLLTFSHPHLHAPVIRPSCSPLLLLIPLRTSHPFPFPSLPPQTPPQQTHHPPNLSSPHFPIRSLLIPPRTSKEKPQLECVVGGKGRRSDIECELKNFFGGGWGDEMRWLGGRGGGSERRGGGVIIFQEQRHRHQDLNALMKSRLASFH